MSGEDETPIEELNVIDTVLNSVVEPNETEEIKSIASLTEPDETELINKEIEDAIDSVIDDTDISEPVTVDLDVYQQMPEQIETSYSNILQYWQREDSPTTLNTYYEKPYQSDKQENNTIQARETKAFNTAIKTNFHAKMKNEGLFVGEYETFEEKESNLFFKAMNPGLWKFMYDASSFMVFSTK
ncbi:hypothetical protein GF358_04520 [Candidatus Woesearchaeota archaeon]|nr:hypothetical protein [Candidatus Woesearchaeota archaeon]